MSVSECMAQHELLVGHSTLAEQYLNCRIHMCLLRIWNVATQLKTEYHGSIYILNVCVSAFVCVHVGLCVHKRLKHRKFVIKLNEEMRE